MTTSETAESSHSRFVQIVMISQDFRRGKFLDFGQNKSEIIAKLAIGLWLACIHRDTDARGMSAKHERGAKICRRLLECTDNSTNFVTLIEISMHVIRCIAGRIHCKN